MVRGIEVLVGKVVPGEVDSRVIIHQMCCSYFPEYLAYLRSAGLGQITGLHWGYIAGLPQVQASPLMELAVQVRLEVAPRVVVVEPVGLVMEFLPVKNWRLPRH